MIGSLRRRLRDERGIALMVALAATLALGIAVVAVISYTTSNQNSTHLAQAELSARQIAESGMQEAYSVINYQNTSGGNPSAANLLGCAGSDGSSSTTTAPSDCSSGTVSPLVFCITASSGCASGDAGSASVFGCYIGTNDGTCDMNGVSENVTAGNWLIWSTGYARNPNTDKVVSHTVKATVSVTSKDQGLSASVWNYLFSSAPLVNNECQLNVTGQTVTIQIPIFVNGNLCLTSNGSGVEETNQPIDLTVMGKTVFAGNNTFVGTSAAPITSGVSVGGCTSSVNNAVNNPKNSCSSYPWHVTTTDDVPTTTPTPPTPNFDYWYANAPIGPMSGCTSGSLPQVLDTNTTRDNSAPTFDLTPTTSYSCTSGNSELSWNAATKVLTVAGDIYIDGSAQVTTVGAVYQGTASLYLSGTFSFSNQNETLCATTAACDFTSGAWSTSNNMLLIIPADMGGTNAAVALDGNNNKLQAGILAPPSATISLGGQDVEFQGPIIGGNYDWGNNVEIWPVPPITDMPPGAPVDPNVSVSIGSLSYQQ